MQDLVLQLTKTCIQAILRYHPDFKHVTRLLSAANAALKNLWIFNMQIKIDDDFAIDNTLKTFYTNQ